MSIEITMPRLSDTMEQGTLIKWRVKVGDPVKSGDVLADIETDKATMELQSYDDGTVAQLAVKEGQSVAVGKRILLLAGEGESLEQAIEASAKPQKPQEAAASAESETDELREDQAVAAPGRVAVSPLARKLAQEHGVDLGTVRGTGPAGRIIKRDILAAAGQTTRSTQPSAGTQTPAPPTPARPSAPPPPRAIAAPGATPRAGTVPGAGVPAVPAVPGVPGVPGEIVPVSNMRQTIARRLVESKSTIPHFTVTVHINMDPLLSLRQKLNEQLALSPPDTPDTPDAPDAPDALKLSVTDFVVRAAALTLVKHPDVNSSWTSQGIVLYSQVNVGVAVALPQEKGGGLIVPTIRDTANKGLRQISIETRALAQKAKTHGLTLEEMSDGTFTVSNLGMFDVEHFEAIINPPQAAILAVGSSLAKPVVRSGQIVIGQEMSATLSADHRVVDGAMAAQWLTTFRQMLENPAVLLV